jgi:hypothetical protein
MLMLERPGCSMLTRGDAGRSVLAFHDRHAVASLAKILRRLDLRSVLRMVLRLDGQRRVSLV